MATLEDAESARSRNSVRLAAAGAHAIGVEPALPADPGGPYVVVAYVDADSTASLPRYLKVTRGTRQVHVPVRVAMSERYQLE
jgi:hypothetical protein